MEIGFKEVRDIAQDTTKPNVDDTFANMATAKIGDGISSLHADRSGIWLGANAFADAPFSVDMQGNVVLRRISALTGYSTTSEVVAAYTAAIELTRTSILSTVGESYAGVDRVTTLEQTSRDLTIKVGRSGGSNLIKNSSGLKGHLVAGVMYLDIWDGTLVKTDRSSTYDVDTSTESRCGIILDNKTITQTIQTIVGENYIFRCRFNKTALTYLTIGNVVVNASIATSGYVDGSWDTYVREFTANDSSMLITISNTGTYCVIADMVCKKKAMGGALETDMGAYDIPWEQAPNETYGMGYQFDEHGLRVSDDTETLISTLDNEGLVVSDTASATEPDVMRVTATDGLIKNLVAQTSFKVQSYDNPVNSFRILPTSNGVMFVIDG